MAEALGDQVHRPPAASRIVACVWRRSCSRMAGGAAEPSCFAQRVGERAGEVLRLQLPSLVVGEHQSVIAGELERHAAARLPVGPQYCHRRSVDVHHARLAALGVALGHLGGLPGDPHHARRPADAHGGRV